MVPVSSANPIDFVVFHGFTLEKGREVGTIGVVQVKVKKGKGRLTREENLIVKRF